MTARRFGPGGSLPLRLKALKPFRGRFGAVNRASEPQNSAPPRLWMAKIGLSSKCSPGWRWTSPAETAMWRAW